MRVSITRIYIYVSGRRIMKISLGKSNESDRIFTCVRMSECMYHENMFYEGTSHSFLYIVHDDIFVANLFLEIRGHSRGVILIISRREIFNSTAVI